MLIVRQSTARIVTVGPVLDADGVAVTDGVVGDFKISKNGGAPTALNGSATLTHRNTGHYSLSLTTSDLDTVGSAEIVIDDTVNACQPKELTVIEEAVYDAFYAASAPGFVDGATVDVTKLNNSSQSLTDLKDFADTGYDPSAHLARADVAAVNGNTSDPAALSTFINDYSGQTLIASLTGNVGGNVTGSIGSLAAQAKADVNAEADTALSDYGALKPTVAGRTLDVTATGAGGIDWGNVENPTTVVGLSSTTTKNTTDINTKLGTPAGASVSADIAAVKAVDDAVKLKTDNLPASPAAVGSAMTLTSGERDSIAAALFDLADSIESGVTLRKLGRLMAAVLGGKSTNGGADYRNINDSKTVVDSTLDGSGNRTAVSLDLT